MSISCANWVLKSLHRVGAAKMVGQIVPWGQNAEKCPDNRGFPWNAKNGEKRKTSEDIVSKILLSMTQYNLRTMLEPNLFSGHLIRRAPFWSADMHTVHARE